MDRPPNRSRGYSLFEMLVVLSIVGMLAFAGVSYVGSRKPLAVRALMDELEGTIMAAHKLAVSTGKDVSLISKGGWDTSSPLHLAARGSLLNPTSTQLAAELVAAAKTTECFTFKPGNAVNSAAGIVVGDSDWWGRASQGNAPLAEVPPFTGTAGVSGFEGAPGTAGMNLFQGATVREIVLSGVSKRFTTGFWIKVVALQSGEPLQGGPMGLLLVPENGASVYRFYNPGIRNSDGKWRRI